jgi:hypothetical protein
MLCGLLYGCNREDSVRLEWKPGIDANEASLVEARLSDAVLEIQRVVSGTAMFATAAYLYLRDGCSIIVPSAPVELW